jgi:hypothetical protein
MPMNTVFMLLLLGVVGCVNTVRSDGVREDRNLVVEFENFDAHVFPLNALHASGQSISTSELGDVHFWADLGTSVVAVNRNLLLNDVHYEIPGGCKDVWIINGEVYAPKTGIIRPSPMPRKLAEWLDDKMEDFEMAVANVKFDIEKGLYSQSVDFKDERNYCAIFGELYFAVTDGKLMFRGKNYGEIGAGDTVRVDRHRKVTVIRKKAEIK